MRHLRVLIEHLPPTSAFHRAVAGHAWTDVEHLLAIVADRLAENTFVTGKAGQLRGLHRPRPLPRPNASPDGRTGDRGAHSVDDVMSYLDQFKPGAAPPAAPAEFSTT